MSVRARLNLRIGDVPKSLLAFPMEAQEFILMPAFRPSHARLSSLRRELDRCKEAVLRLALLQPGITFTLYDCSKRAFVIKLMAVRFAGGCCGDGGKVTSCRPTTHPPTSPFSPIPSCLLQGRPLEASVAQYLMGSTAEGALTALQPDPLASIAVGGWAALPPLGAPSASKQLVYINGHCVRAAPLCKLVDSLFVMLYRPNARLHFAAGVGEELQSQHRAANRHAAFVLQLRCAGASVRIDADGELADAQFRDWEPVLAAVKHAVLSAWQPVLNLALLAELAQLEKAGGRDGGMEVQEVGRKTAASAAAAAAAEALPFEAWLQQEQSGEPLDELLQAHQQRQQAAQVGAGKQLATADANESSKRDSGRQRTSGRAHRPTLVGARHSMALASRPLRFGDASSGAALQQQQQQQQGDKIHAPTSTMAGGDSALTPPRKRVRIADTPQIFQLSPSVLEDASGQQQQRQEQQQKDEEEDEDLLEEEGLDSKGRLIRSWRPLMAHSNVSTVAASSCGGSGQQQLLLLPDHLLHSPGSLDFGLGSDCGMEQGGSAGPKQGGHAWLQPEQHHEQQQQHGVYPGLSFEERLLLETAVAPVCPPKAHRPRPQSAPPHVRQRRRTVHTNPLLSLQAAAGTGKATWGGMRGPHTVSGLGWRQQKATVERATTKAEPASMRNQPSAAPPQRGLQLDLGTEALVGATAAARPPVMGSALPAPLPPTVQQPLPPTRAQAVPVAMPAGPPQPAELPQPLAALLSNWRNPAMVSEVSAGKVVLALTDLEAACFAQLRPAALSRAQMQAAVALRQVDDKFVPLVAGSLLAVVDQHAADERVQLEALRTELLSEGGRGRCVAAMPLRLPQPLVLSDGEVQLLEAFGDRAAAWGWRWMQQSCGGSGSGSGLALTHAPLLFGTATLSSADLKLYLHQLADAGGAAGLLPPGVVRVLNSRACRGAVMFGDRLLPAQCQALLDALKATQLCFSCAHGRPTTVPLVDLALLRRAMALRQRAGGGGSCGAQAEGGRAAAPAPVDLNGLRAKLQRDLQQQR